VVRSALCFLGDYLRVSVALTLAVLCVAGVPAVAVGVLLW
jgi:hypothetical protein